ncbi:MAG: hypothetical protein ACRC2K_03950 [Clostridium sp.]
MIQVFCGKRGSGKTKRLIQLANEHVKEAKGNLVFIDDDSSYMRQVDRRVRFVSTEDFNINDCQGFYGMLCGILAENYDIENIYIDGLLNIVSCDLEETAYLFNQIRNLSNKYNFNVYMNINHEDRAEVPTFIKEYVA